MKRWFFAVLSLAVGVALIVVSFTVAGGRGWVTDTLRIAGLVVATVSVVEIAVRLLRRRRVTDQAEPPEKEKPQYAVKRNYLSAAERNFLLLLRGIKPEKYEVIPQVALAAVLDKVTCATYRNELFRIIDYMFVDRDTFEPLLLVELNDASHLKADRAERDRKVAEICASAGMPLITFWTRDKNSFEEVRKVVLTRLRTR